MPEEPTRSLVEYRETLEKIGQQGAVSVTYALEMLEAAESALEQQSGEHTLSRAITMSGRSRSWWESRLPHLQATKLARKEGAIWLIKDAAIPRRKPLPRDGFSESDNAADIADRLLKSA